ncbi:right-handed parallel beta-helix repeat-containing protein [Pseudactinotalea sp. Z1739]|uniref:right-handed parallel beta-helix repeat-containing protein n=1 Tax=Pseudactinotalea sp. Z1739 TaxID=3413028 RepID=UPI003C7BB6FF
MSAVLHVATTGSDRDDGSASAPLRTINHAAQIAQPGDTVLVHGGVYREWVRPAHGGRSDRRRITYQAADGEQVVIKGSEQITGWERDGGTVWRATIDNSLFGEFNPFAETVSGDWVLYPAGAPPKHLGEVYLNGRSFYEVHSRAEVADPPLRTSAVDHWTDTTDHIRDPEQTRFVWYAEVGRDSTTVWANFQDADPNQALVEVNVRPAVFLPDRPHVDYITVRGFELAQAATPWTPPTADQPGLIGPNWAKGWVIENNIIHDAKCSAISIGKEASTGHNFATTRRDKPGYQYQIESVFTARQYGWDREHIGSHVIRGNTIYDCGQNGIVGHLGCVFSTIEDNHIHNIAIKREFFGHEIGGIKLHAPIDVQISRNRIHDCTLAIWLDWQTQGTRVNHNILYANKRDLFIEVSHGPYLVDHNLLASPVAIESMSQGGAYVHNLVGGSVRIEQEMERATPYHLPHSTQVAGYAFIQAGDDRWLGNIFLGGDIADAYGPDTILADPNAGYGLAGYNGYPGSFAEYIQRVHSRFPNGDHRRFNGVPQAVYARENLYLAGARPFEGEDSARVLAGAASLQIHDDGDAGYLHLLLPEGSGEAGLGVITSEDLPRVRLVDAEFDQPDGSPVVLGSDLLGRDRTAGARYPAGPFAEPAEGESRRRLW